MIYMKHAEHGNRHFEAGEQAAREADGWVRWPRTKEQKAGIQAKPAPVAEPVPATSTREDLERQARALGVAFRHRLGDKKLAEAIAAAVQKG